MRLLWLLVESGPQTLAEVTSALGLERSTVNRQVNAAVAAGLLGAALLVTLPFVPFEHEAVTLHPHFIGALAWSVVGLTVGGSSLLYMLIQRGAAAQVTSLMYLVPPCTAGAVLLERATGWQVWGVVLVVYIASLFGSIVIPAKRFE